MKCSQGEECGKQSFMKEISFSRSQQPKLETGVAFLEHQPLQKTSLKQVSVFTLNECALIATITDKAFAYSEELPDLVWFIDVVSILISRSTTSR